MLSTLTWLPVVWGIGLTVLARTQPLLVSPAAVVGALITFVLSLMLYAGFDPAGGMQYTEDATWIAAFDIRYHLGVDGIAVPLVLLTTFSTLLVTLFVRMADRPALHLGAFLVLEGLMIGVFAARDAVLFYVFWEAMLIPMFIIIGVWGGPRRVYAAIKFFLYTFLGSVFMLVALLYLYHQSGSFAIDSFHAQPLNHTEQVLIFIAFLLAFAVKIPMWPVHTWLPDAHVEAPTGGSVILAAVMLKMGGYGFLRFSLPIAPQATAALDMLMITLSLVAIAYIGMVALAQQDMKKLIAYSSVAHMGFVTLGFFLCFTAPTADGIPQAAMLGLQGGMVQMISHGFISGALFLCVGVLYDRTHSRQIADYGGVVNTMPRFAALLMLFAMANAGLPGTSGFVGEFLVILAGFQANFWIALIAASTLVLGAAYTLWMYKRVIFGEVANQQVAALKDLDTRETLVLGLAAAAVLLLGIWPAPLVELMNPSLEQLLEQVWAKHG